MVVDNGCLALFAGADFNCIGQRVDEDFAVAGLTCFKDFLCYAQNFVHRNLADNGFYFNLRHKVNIVSLPAVNFFMPLLQTAAKHLAYRHAGNANFRKSKFQFVQFFGSGYNIYFGNRSHNCLRKLFACRCRFGGKGRCFLHGKVSKRRAVYNALAVSAFAVFNNVKPAFFFGSISTQGCNCAHYF